MVHKCSNCYWQQDSGFQHGCFKDSKWRKWIPKKTFDVPNTSECWRSKE